MESPLRYIIGNPTSLRNATFHWLTSAYMQWQAVLCSWQPLDVGATKYTAFLKGNVNSALELG